MQTAVTSYSEDVTSHSAAQQLVTQLGSLREAAEARPKVWLSLMDAQKDALPAIVAGLLQWQLPLALERGLQLFMLLLPASEIPKDGLKWVHLILWYPASEPLPCPALPCPVLPCPALPSHSEGLAQVTTCMPGSWLQSSLLNRASQTQLLVVWTLPESSPATLIAQCLSIMHVHDLYAVAEWTRQPAS